MSEHVYNVKKDFDIAVLTTGYKFIWEQPERPTLKEYPPQKMEEHP